LQGDLGVSLFTGLPVSQMIGQRLAPTFSLMIMTLILSVTLAVPLGALAAWRHNKFYDRRIMMMAVLSFSIPSFVVGYLLAYAFGLELRWLPVQGYKSLLGPSGAGLWDWMRQLILPWMTLAMVYVALIARVTRASVSEALTEDYIRTARAKGLTETAVLLRHALANAAVPIVTVIGIGVALLIGGVVVTETVYAIPGLGSLTVDAVLNRDFPVIQGLVLMFSVSYVMVNLLVDLSYLFLDPRIRY
jgi:peptide/nickel transport system permease protein